MGNTFLEQSGDLLVLDSKGIMDAAVAETVKKVKSVGEEQYKHFKEERLEKCTKPIIDVILKNKLPLFSRPPVKTSSKKQFQLATLKSDFSLFSRLYRSCQTRDRDLEKFFSYENQAAPVHHQCTIIVRRWQNVTWSKIRSSALHYTTRS